ncbi:MAG TPA: thiamine pyrophosphate-dependent enzyme [bacterium]|nr:thiamine pyrophosphate-dependent enzyme [bacterium]
MNGRFLSTENLPFCKGCGHHIVSQNLEKALSSIEGFAPLDVIVVTDIGCIGIIDKQFATHTVHGLHGRSVALAAGIAMATGNPKKKIIALLGDGGATIGLQHLMEAAQRNINLTVIVHNNMLYGMTGGQPSGLTPRGFKTPIMPDGKPNIGYDLCRVLHAAGAPSVRRLLALGDFSNDLAEALKVPGFSFVEAMEICPSYGVKFNPNRKLDDIAKEAGIEVGHWAGPAREPYRPATHAAPASLFAAEKPIAARHKASLKERYAVVLSGSAGEGVQSAAEFLAQAALSCGLHATKKGSYPVTVGVGFSTAEILLSPQPLHFTGISVPDAVIATSQDGLNKVRGLVEKMTKGTLYLDASLEAPATKATVVKHDFRGPLGGRSAVLVALTMLLDRAGIMPTDAFLSVLKESSLGKKLDFAKLRQTAG